MCLKFNKICIEMKNVNKPPGIVDVPNPHAGDGIDVINVIIY